MKKHALTQRIKTYKEYYKTVKVEISEGQYQLIEHVTRCCKRKFEKGQSCDFMYISQITSCLGGKYQKQGVITRGEVDQLIYDCYDWILELEDKLRLSNDDEECR